MAGPLRINEIVLEGETAVVTGGGQGLGRAVALALSQAGAKVVLMDRNRETMRVTEEEIRSRGGNCRAFQGDVTQIEDIQRLVEFTCREFGRPYILVNNAGISLPRRPVVEIDPADWHMLMNVNLHAVFFCSQAFAREMIKEGRGRIVNMASMVGRVARPGIVPYATAKGAVIQLTRALAVDLAPYGINVNAVAPGYVPTAISEPILSNPAMYEEVIRRTPLGRVGTADEIAAAVLYLCSPLAGYITGQTIFADGGWTSC